MAAFGEEIQQRGTPDSKMAKDTIANRNQEKAA
jgi:hypothetical protein